MTNKEIRIYKRRRTFTKLMRVLAGLAICALRGVVVYDLVATYIEMECSKNAALLVFLTFATCFLFFFRIKDFVEDF